MTEENNLPVKSTEDELASKGMLNDMMMETAMESLNQYMPQVKGMLVKGSESFKKYLGGDKKRILIQQDPSTNEIFMIILETKGIASFQITPQTYTVYPLQKFLDIVNSTNDLSDIEKNFKDLK